MNDLTSKYVGKTGKWNPNLAFLTNEVKNYRFLCLPGGMRSGKTYSELQWTWRLASQTSGMEYSIVRNTLPALKATAIKDFIEIGTKAGFYNPKYHNKTDKEIKFNGNLIDYFSLDDSEKAKGRKRDILYLNEGPEMPWEIVKQLIWRTTRKIIIDYNPSYPESWVYDKILTRKDCAFIVTTYRDNPHLPKEQLQEIEWMRENAPEDYKVYGMGQRGELKGQVYNNWKRCEEFPIDYPHVVVIDFGYSNDPAAIAKFSKHNRTIFGKELDYSTGMDNLDIAIALFFNGVKYGDMTIADSAEPKSIAEIRRGWDYSVDAIRAKINPVKYQPTEDQIKALVVALKKGYLVQGAVKGADSVRQGIQRVKQHEVLITGDSGNAWKEYYTYRYPEDPATGALLNIPVGPDHFCDCLRMYSNNEGRLY